MSFISDPPNMLEIALAADLPLGGSEVMFAFARDTDRHYMFAPELNAWYPIANLSEVDAAKDRANHTGTQAISTVTGLQTTLDGKESLSNKSTTTTLGTSNTLYPTQNAAKTYVDAASRKMWLNGVLKPGAFPYAAKVTTASGNALVHLTDNGLSGGNAVFTNVYADSIVCIPYGTTNNLQPGTRTFSNSNKTLTIEVRQTLLALAVLSLTTAANGLDCVIIVWGD